MTAQAMTKKTPSYQHHTLDVYGCALYLATTPKQWRAVRRILPFLDAKAPTSAGLVHFAIWQPRQGLHEPVAAVYVNLKQHTNRLDLVDTLAHEATHLAQQLLHHIGHHPTNGHDEPSAYLVGWLTRWLWGSIDSPLTTP